MAALQSEAARGGHSVPGVRVQSEDWNGEMRREGKKRCLVQNRENLG